MILVLEKIDLKQSLKKDAYNEKMSYFEHKMRTNIKVFVYNHYFVDL